MSLLGETWHSFEPTACPSSACQAGFMALSGKHTKHKHVNNGVFSQVCSNAEVLELSQRLQICMKQEEVTLGPKGKPKMPTFTQLLVKTLSQNKETECAKTHCTHLRRLSY